MALRSINSRTPLQLNCDVAILGAGTAGLAARHAAAAAGAKTLFIERGPGGTTCARCGCMPSKLLLAAARAARDMRGADIFGIGSGKEPEIHGADVMARVRRERDHFVASVLKEVRAIPAAERITGNAKFAGPHTLLIDDHSRIDAKAIVIATGAKPQVPDDLAAACSERLLTHETVFELETLPSTLAVIGAGPLGLELAVAFARLGVHTTVFDQTKAIGGLNDPGVEHAARKSLAKEMDFHLGVDVQAILTTNGDVQLVWHGKGGVSGKSTFQYVLCATGRSP